MGNMECSRRDCVKRISVHLKLGKLLRELFAGFCWVSRKYIENALIIWYDLNRR